MIFIKYAVIVVLFACLQFTSHTMYSAFKIKPNKITDLIFCLILYIVMYCMAIVLL